VQNILADKAPAQIVIPFVCPICAGANAVHLISLSRAGGMECVVCEKWLRATDVMRAMHSPRAARDPHAEDRARAAPAKKVPITWPPTAESRAAAKPLGKRDEAEYTRT